MIRIDRKGRPPEYIPRPALTLGLMIQPEVLRTNSWRSACSAGADSSHGSCTRCRSHESGIGR